MGWSKRLRGRAFLGSSAIAIGTLSAGAHATCSPNPPVAYGNTICTGIEANGVVATAFGSRVSVEKGAVVQPGSNDAAVTLSGAQTLTVAGIVEGGSRNGVLITSGGYTLGVFEGGSISGSRAITLTGANASLENAGTLTGLAGPAIVSENGANLYILDNAQAGIIGGVSGTVSSTRNYGAIDGGIYAAFANPQSSYIYNDAVGIFRSGNSVSTINTNGGTIGNGGLISNTGTGAAIVTSDTLYLSNSGRIQSTSGPAVVSSSALTLINTGRIVGSIINGAATQASAIDTSGGAIIGDVLFGSGDDTFTGGAYDTSLGRFANVSGIVDGGAGIDTAQIGITQDATLDSVGLPLNFERLQLTLSNEATVELADGFDMSRGVSVGGTGSLIINRDVESVGPVVTSVPGYPSQINLSTSGSITATLGDVTEFAINLDLFASGENSGTIRGIGGGGVRLFNLSGLTTNTGYTNNGTVIADGTGISIGGKLTNNGLIRSLNGIGVVAGTIPGTVNNGIIEGHNAGILLTGNFDNAGTISATDGIGVDLGYGAQFANLADGIVNGTTAAIGVSGYFYSSIVSNAGVINGDVRLINTGFFDSSDDIFLDAGGIVNGNLLLGGGDDYLITDLGKAGPLAGVTGAVDAGEGYDRILYRVLASVTAELAVPATFEAAGYELTDGQTLTLASAVPQTLGLAIGGTGSATIDVQLEQTDHAVLDLAPPTIGQLTTEGAGVANALDVVSNGTLSLTATQPYAHGVGAVNAGTANFENAGTIRVTNSGNLFQPSAIFGGTLVTNSGSILLDGAVGVSGSTQFINSGSITQVTGAGSSQGVAFVGQLVNSGTISVDGNAVVTNSYFYSPQPAIRNSGVIDSHASIAIVGTSGDIINESTGLIRGAVDAISGDGGGKLINAGTIYGNVVLGSPFASFGQGSKYLANGGTLSGNLQFGALNDTVLARDGITGVTGTIDAGEGYDVFGRFYTASTSTAIGKALPTTFEGELVEAIGADTIVTLTGNSDGPRGLTIAGDGQIVNRANIAGLVIASGDNSVAVDGIGVLSSFTNEGELGAGFDGAVTSFVNKGTIIGPVGLYLDGMTAFNYGTINGDVLLTGDASRFIEGISATVTGQVQAYGDDSSLLLDITGGGALDDAKVSHFFGFNHFGLIGNGAISSSGVLPVETILLSGAVELKAGSALETKGAVAITGTQEGNQIVNRGAIIGAIDLGDQDDRLTNFGMIDGDVYLGGGHDQMVHNIGGSLTGTVDGGGGTDNLIIDINGGGRLDQQLLDRFINFETETISGSGAITIDGPLAIDSLFLRDANLTIASGQVLETQGPNAIVTAGGTNSITNRGTIRGGLNLTGGSSILTNGGLISGLVTFGDGNDQVMVEGDAIFGGSVDGGSGTDIARVSFAGTDNAPQIRDLSGFKRFEMLKVQSGTGALEGVALFTTIDVDGGRLIGLSGSTISGAVTVAQGATFGSASTVNGNITVNGTLSPGASPGTMTVNGNIALNAGSNTLFEFTPTVSDALIINGSLTIASGATLTMTGNRPLTPGIYTMVNANGGITGTFGTNVMRDSTVLGVLSYTQNTIDLIGMFQSRAGVSAQVVATTDYLNDLLLNGEATSGILSAFPVLVSADGYASPVVLSTLSPEPYASAAQMGIENGLAVSGALRNIQLAGLSDEGGLFVFGQAYGQRRTFDGDIRGTADADVASSGYLGGVGYGNSTLGATLFVGKSDSRQHLRPLGARNHADGLFFGGRVHYAASGFSAGATVIFDRAKADTERSPATGGTARSHYGLRGTTLDGWLSYGFPVGEAWKIGPQVGITHVSIERGAINEAGGGAFALEIAKQTYKATFLTADLKLEAPGFATLRPWAIMGIRHRLQSDAISATGGFTGTSASYTVAGIERKKTLPRVGGGINVSLSQSVSLFVNGDAEFSGRNGESHVNGGITFRF